MNFDGADGYMAGLRALAQAFAPRRPLPISEWAARHRILSGKSASEPGRWRNERIPYLAAIMDALDARDPARQVIFVSSSQVGKSECALNWIGSVCHQDPESFLALFPTEKVARKWVRTRLDSMIATTPELRAILPPGRRSSAGNTLQEKHGPGFVIYTGSANIPDDVASVSVPNLLLDELDRMPSVLEGEGDPIELAMRRLATFPRAKCFMTSTPTTQDTSRIWPAWESSSMGRYFVPCTHCAHRQYLRWDQLKWPDAHPEQAMYACESCGGLIEERAKGEILAAGEWRHEHPDRMREVKGFHANGLMTPIGLGDSWAQHAMAWARAEGAPERMQVFMNTRLGEIVKSERRIVAWDALSTRAEPFDLRTIPFGYLILTSGTDVQADRLETQIVGWGRDESACVIDYVVHRGDTTRPEVWTTLDDYLAGEIVNAFGVPMRLSCSLIDSGYLPETVLNFTRERRARRIYASRGSSIAAKLPIGRPSYPDTKGRGAPDKRGVERYEVGVSMIKHWLYDRLQADAGTADDPVQIADRHVRFSAALPQDYFRQLTAETFDPRKGWIARANFHRNEALDTFVLARAAALHHAVALHRMREADWTRLERLFERGTTVPNAIENAPPIATPMILSTGFMPSRASIQS